jgi:hypothetical protein
MISKVFSVVVVGMVMARKAALGTMVVVQRVTLGGDEMMATVMKTSEQLQAMKVCKKGHVSGEKQGCTQTAMITSFPVPRSYMIDRRGRVRGRGKGREGTYLVTRRFTVKATMHTRHDSSLQTCTCTCMRDQSPKVRACAWNMDQAQARGDEGIHWISMLDMIRSLLKHGAGGEGRKARVQGIKVQGDTWWHMV